MIFLVNFLINTQVLRLRKALANNSSADIKLSKTQLHKTRQSRGFIGRLYRTITRNRIAFDEKCT